MIRLANIYNELNERQLNIKGIRKFLIDPNNKLVRVGKHHMTKLQNYYDFDINRDDMVKVFNTAFKDGWVRGIMDHDSIGKKYRLSIDVWSKDRAIEILKMLYNTIIHRK